MKAFWRRHEATSSHFSRPVNPLKGKTDWRRVKFFEA